MPSLPRACRRCHAPAVAATLLPASLPCSCRGRQAHAVTAMLVTVRATSLIVFLAVELATMRPCQCEGAPHKKATDEELVGMCLQGDLMAWAALLRRYRRLICSVPVSFGFGPSDCDDIYQNLSLTLYEQLHAVNDIGKLYAWLITTARHECIALANQNKKDLETENEEVDAEKVLDVLKKRFAKYGLTLYPDKTRLMECSVPFFGAAVGGCEQSCLGIFKQFETSEDTWIISRNENWCIEMHHEGTLCRGKGRPDFVFLGV